MSAQARARLNEVIHAGKCMDYAERLRAHTDHSVTGALAEQYASALGIGKFDLRTSVLPILKAAGVIDYREEGGQLVSVEEYVSLAAPFLEQVENVLEKCSPSDEQWAALTSVQLGTLAPLARRDHVHKIASEFADQIAQNGATLALASGVLRRARSSALNEDVLYNPAVWGTEAVNIAQFLRGLPGGERDALLSVVESTSARRGLALPSAAIPENILRGARRVGLVQAATVRSTSGGVASQTYLFPALNVVEDAARGVTEALHERKLVAAHFMFGHERALAGRGRISSPVILVEKLLERGRVGPASNIGTDYHLLEAAGIVAVDPGVDRPFLRLVKEDIVADALGWLRQIYGNGAEADSRGVVVTSGPGVFVSPERDQSSLADDGAANEIADAAILSLREEIARVQRGERA